MRHMQYLVLFFLVNILCVSQSFGDELRKMDTKSQGEKIYVKPSQIHIESDGIFVNLSNQWIPTESIHLDSNGVYVTSASSDRVSFSWTCPKCGHENSWYHNSCQVCGHR